VDGSRLTMGDARSNLRLRDAFASQAGSPCPLRPRRERVTERRALNSFFLSSAPLFGVAFICAAQRQELL
jgi:hypothetical protein